MSKKEHYKMFNLSKIIFDVRLKKYTNKKTV